MGAIGYLYRTVMKNRIRTALHKPITYFYLVIILIYLTAVPFSLKMLAEQAGAASSSGMAGVLTAFAFWMIPGNLIAYAKRKGLIYGNCDVHFLFPSPVSPKKVLLYAHIRTIPMQILLNIFAAVCGGVIFGVELWRLLVYFFFAIFGENVLEASVMMMMYGSERLKEEQRTWIIRAAYGLLIVLAVIGVVFYLQQGLSFATLVNFLHSDAVQLVPVIGWYVSVLHLLFTGATTVNLVGTALYVILFLTVVIAAVRMKCTGAYYEDAVKFAEDYEELKESRRQGNTTKRLGKKEKFGKASVRWQGSGAKALFYRQLLEYKKSRFFIFDISTLFALIAGIAIAILYVREGGFEDITPFVIPGASAYLIFISTTVNGKWAKELKAPYTYLIPASSFAKLWNATVLQLLQNFINGLLITLPGAVVMEMSPVTAVFCVLFYTVLASNKLYALAVAEIAVGGVLGVTGKQLFQMLIQGIVIAVAALGAYLGTMFGSINGAYLIMDLVLAAFTLVFMIVATLNFDRMETA